MQLSTSQSLILALVLLDGARAAAIPRRGAPTVDLRQVQEPDLIVEALASSELLPNANDISAVLHQYDERGLLDPLLDPLSGVLGAVSGVLSGVLGQVTNVVGGLVGALGSILITDPSSGAQGMNVYLVQASNTSMALVQASNVTDPALLAAMNMSKADTVLATLHVPVVNQTTMNIVDMCVTSTGPGAGAITASPCRTTSLSQLFVYNSNTNAVYSVPDLLACAYAADNATTTSTPAAAPVGGTTNIIMVERDVPTMSTCNATSKAIVFSPSNMQQAVSQAANEAVVTVTPSQASSVAGNTTPGMDFAAGDHNPAAL